MTADFNAGSIEGTLDLDIRPFIAGLKKAQIEADNFQRRQINARLGLDSTEFSAKQSVADRKLTEFDRRKATAKADLDISPFLAKLAIADSALRKSLDFGGTGNRTVTGGLFVGKFTAIAGGLLSIAAAAGPAGAAMLGFGAASTTALGGAEASLGLFAKVLMSDFANIQKAIKAGTQLSGPAGVAETALKHLTAAWTNFQKASGSVGYRVLTTAFNGLAGILPKLVPLLRTTGQGVEGIVRDLVALTHQPIFDQFLAHLQAFMHGFLAGAGPVLTSLLSGFMHAFIVMQPLMAALGHGVTQLVDAGQHFAAGGGLKTFVDYVLHVTPEVVRLLSDTVHGLINLGKGIAPLAQPALHFIDSLVRAIGGLNLAPFARGFGAVLTAANPLLHVLEVLINTVLTPMGRLLGSLAHSVITPLAHSLSGELHPAFHALSQILNALVKPLSAFLGSIANLVNPTGVHLLTSLLQMLVRPIQILAPAIGHLAVALEGVVDKGINALMPLLPRLKPLLDAVAHGAANFANGLASILSHKDAALALLGVVGAIKALQLGMAAYRGVTALAAAAQLGFTAAMDGTKIATMLTTEESIVAKGVMLATRGVTIAWTAAQWLLNAALRANPIGIVITALTALAAGFIYAYKHSETFRNIVNGALHAVEAAAKAVWGWMKAAWNDLGVAFQWVWNHYLKYVLDIYKLEFRVLWTVLKGLWSGMQTAWHALGIFFQWVYNNVLKPIWGWFRDAAQLLWQFLKNTWQGLQNDWHALGSFFNSVWNNVIKPVFNFFKNAVGDVVQAFRTGVDAIQTAWNRIKAVAEAPVRFVVGTVLDKGIIGSMNKLGGIFHLPSIPTVPVPFAQGSWVPGHSASDTADNVTARLTPGEFVVRRKSAANVEQKHPGSLEYINKHGDLPKYGLGGWIDNAASSVSGALTGAFDWTKNLVGSLNPISMIKSHVEALLNQVGGGSFGKLAAGAGEHVLTGAMSWLKSKMGSMLSALKGGAMGTVGSGVQRWAPDVLRVLAMLGQPASLLGVVLARMTRESGGNPMVPNLWDSNAAAGHPSVGLMQVIGPTFDAYAGPFRNVGPFSYGVSVNPLANIYAGLNYALHQYGSIYRAMTQSGGYAGGTMSATPGWHRVGERGPELLRFRGGEQVLPTGAHGDDIASLLRTIISLLARQKPTDLDALASALDKHSQATMRQMVQIARAK